MKQCSPILLFFIVSLLFSCRDSKSISGKDAATNGKIYSYIQKAENQNLPDSIRIKNGDKAVTLAKKTKNDSLLYRALFIKIQNDIYTGGDSLPENFKVLKKISKNDAWRLGGYNQEKALSNYAQKDSSYYYHQEAKKLYSKAKDSLMAGFNLLMMAEIQTASSDYNAVQTLATESLSFLKNTKSKEYIVNAYTILGLSHIQLQDYDQALKDFNHAIAFSDSKLGKRIIENNIGKVYKETKEYDKAIAILSDLSKDPILDQNLGSKARILDNLGHCLFLNGNPEGLQFMIASLKIKDSINDNYGRLASHLHLSEYYLKSNLSLSKFHAKIAVSLAQELDNDEDELEAIKSLSKTTETKVEAEKLFSDYIVLNETSKTKRQKANNKFAKIKYDSKSAEEETLKSKAESAQNKLIAEKANNRNILAIIFILFLLITIFLSYKLLKIKHSKEKIKEVYNTETRISKKVHDELANDVYKAMNFANNQDFHSAEKKEALLATLDSIYSRTRDISRENSEIDLGENYPLQLKEMLSEYQSETLNVIITDNETINWNTLDNNKKTVAFRILQELMVNMKKHSQATLTVIKFELHNKNVAIQYSDNGIGFRTEKTFFKNGLQNVENRILGINGKITFDKKTSKGVKIFIVFPS